MLDNLLIGRHCRSRPNIFSELLFTPGVRQEELRHRAAVEEIIDFLDLANYREQRISGLPYGVRKVVELARALCAEPKLLLLDEPASGLNTEETEEVAFWIEDIKNDLGITVIMIEHDMSLVSAVSDRVLALNNGRTLALGTPARGAIQPGRHRGLSRERGGMSEACTVRCASSLPERRSHIAPPLRTESDRGATSAAMGCVRAPPVTPTRCSSDLDRLALANSRRGPTPRASPSRRSRRHGAHA